LREFETGADTELRAAMLDLGYVEVKLPDVFIIKNAEWNDHEGFMRRLGGRYRSDLRREVLKHVDALELLTDPPRTTDEVHDCYELYCNVFDRAFELNVFRLPFSFFERMCHDPNYDVLRLVRRDDPQRRPVAVMWSFAGKRCYNALVVGLDYSEVASHDVYKHILYRTVLRARELGCCTIDLAYTAAVAKKKVGARPQQRCAYVQIEDHFSQALMETLDSAAGEVAAIEAQPQPPKVNVRACA
jgi:hypothetical protein